MAPKRVLTSDLIEHYRRESGIFTVNIGVFTTCGIQSRALPTTFRSLFTIFLASNEISRKYLSLHPVVRLHRSTSDSLFIALHVVLTLVSLRNENVLKRENKLSHVIKAEIASQSIKSNFSTCLSALLLTCATFQCENRNKKKH